MDTVSFLNNYSGIFVRFSGIMLVQSSILILALLTIDLLLRQKVRAVFRYCLWMLLLVKLVLPVGLSLPYTPAYWAGNLLPETNILPPDTNVNVIDSPQPSNNLTDPTQTNISTGESVPYKPVEIPAATANVAPVAVAEPAQEITTTQHTPTEIAAIQPLIDTSSDAEIQQFQTPVTWQSFAVLAWLVAVLVMLGLLIQRVFFVKILIRQSRLADQNLISQLKQCALQMSMRPQVDIRISPNATSPSVCGLVHPVILMPDNLSDHLSKNQVDAILMHELAHIKRGDLWVNLIQALLQITYFYNPLLWVANAVIRSTREQAVDEMVLVAMADRADDYPQTLLSVSKLVWSKPALSLRLIGVVESKSALTSRIKHILSRPFPKSAKLGLIGLAAIIIAAFALLPMAKVKQKDNPVPKNSAYEIAKGSKDYKIKVGPTRFEAHTVVRWNGRGSYTMTNPANDALVNMPVKVPDYSKQSAWMDIAHVYFSPKPDKYDVLELRVFDHLKRKRLTSEDYIGVSYNVENSVVNLFSLGQLLPESVDIWMRVMHRPGGEKKYKLMPNNSATAKLGKDTIQIVDVAKGRYNWQMGKKTKHHQQYDDHITSLAVKFQNARGKRRYQLCAVGVDGRRVRNDSAPHFVRASNGWQLLKFGMKLDDIDHFEITPSSGRDTFFFEDVKLPKVRSADSFEPCPQVRFKTGGKEGVFTSNALSPLKLELHTIAAKVITGSYAGTQDYDVGFTLRDGPDDVSSIVCRIKGLQTKNYQFSYYDKDSNSLDLKSMQSGSAMSTTLTQGYVKIERPLEDIHTVGLRITDKPDETLILHNNRHNKPRQRQQTHKRHNTNKKETPAAKTTQIDKSKTISQPLDVKPVVLPEGKSNINAALTYGARVHFAGIINDDPAYVEYSGSPMWFSPDGKFHVKEQAPQLKPQSSKENTGYVFRLKADSLLQKEKPQIGYIQFSPRPAVTNSFGTQWTRGITTLDSSVQFPKAQKTVDVTLNISNGPWLKSCVYDVKTKRPKSFNNNVSGYSYFEQSVEEDGKKFSVTVRHPIKNMAHRVVAVLKDGAIKKPSAYNRNKSDVAIAWFDKTILGRIAQFEHHVQAVETVTFKNVSLVPGEETVVTSTAPRIVDHFPDLDIAHEEVSVANNKSGGSMRLAVADQDNSYALKIEKLVHDELTRWSKENRYNSKKIWADLIYWPKYSTLRGDFRATGKSGWIWNQPKGDPPKVFLKVDKLKDGIWYLQGIDKEPKDWASSLRLELLIPESGKIPKDKKAALLTEARKRFSAVRKPNPKWTRTLANGVEIEFAAITEYPDPGKQWWAPDGKPLSYQPVFGIFQSAGTSLNHRHRSKKRYEMAFAIKWPNIRNTFMQMNIFIGDKPGASRGGRLAGSEVVTFPVKLDRDLKTFDVTLKIALDDIKFETVTFKNISLRPGVNNNAEVVFKKEVDPSALEYKQAYLSESSEPNLPNVLDLATGETLTTPDKLRTTQEGLIGEYYTKLGKGDLWWRDGDILGTCRNGYIQAWDGSILRGLTSPRSYNSLRFSSLSENKLSIPCRLLVVTGDNKFFDVMLVRTTDEGKIEISYRPTD